MSTPKPETEFQDQSVELQLFFEHLKRQPEEKKKLEALLLEGFQSPSIVADETFWAERRRKILDKHPELDDQ